MITKKNNQIPNLIFDLDNIMIMKNITEEKLSKDTGLSINFIKQLCKNKVSQIDIQILAKLCYALKCQPNDIIKFK